MQDWPVHIKNFLQSINKALWSFTTVFTGVLIFLNYYYGIHDWINGHSFYPSFFYRYCLSAIAFLSPYFFLLILKRKQLLYNKKILLLLFIAPSIFSLKMVFIINLSVSDNPFWNNYWNHVLYWPALLIITASLLLFIREKWYKNSPFWGMSCKSFQWKPYFLLLFLMVPLIVWASTQHDFLQLYPRLKMVSGTSEGIKFNLWHQLLFELSYGIDFVTIELFFRGFLVLAFVKWFGKDAIIPMACFYATVHFGKPLGECIGSYFGGMILGILVYKTQSLWGSLFIHLGVAWMMELGGYLGNIFSG